MIRLQRDQNWDQPLQCPQVFDGKKQDVEAHGESQSAETNRNGETETGAGLFGVLGLIKQDMMSERLYISQLNVSEGLFLLPRNKTFVVTWTIFILTGLIERETDREK